MQDSAAADAASEVLRCLDSLVETYTVEEASALINGTGRLELDAITEKLSIVTAETAPEERAPVVIIGPHICDASGCRKFGAFKKCARCRTVYYCSPDCQTKDWKHHKLQCRQTTPADKKKKKKKKMMKKKKNRGIELSIRGAGECNADGCDNGAMGYSQHNPQARYCSSECMARAQ
jgi:hypothetical protein